MVVDQLAQRDPVRRDVHARPLHPSADRPEADALALAAASRREGLAAALEDLAVPVQRLDVVDQRGPAEHAELRGERRTQPRLAATTLDRLDQARLLAADVRARAAPEVDPRQRARPVALERRDLLLEQRTARRVLVAQVEVDVAGFDRPRGDQHALQHAVRIGLHARTGP